MSKAPHIAFDFICDEAPLFARIATNLQEKGFVVSGLTLGNRWKEYWQPFDTVATDVTESYTEQELDTRLRAIEQQYGEYYPAGFLHSERFLYGRSRHEQKRFLVGTFEKVENYFRQYRPDIYICPGIAFIYHLVSCAVCKNLGIPHLALYSTRGAEPRFTYAATNGDEWTLVREIYESLADDEVEQKYFDLLASLRTQLSVPHYMNYARQSISFKLVHFREFFLRFKRYYFEGWKCAADYYTQPPWFYARRDGFKIIWGKTVRYLKDTIFDKADLANDKYYLFAIHLQPESSTLVQARWYLNQVETIRNVSMCLPADSLLYVKEHRSAVGYNSWKFYQDIKKNHNVKLIEPWENTPRLIRHSRGLITLTSTMGWETMLIGKPLYVLGDAFYNSVKPELKLGSYEELKRVLKEGITSPMVSDLQLAKFLKAIECGSWPGLFETPKMDTKDPVMNERNIDQCTEGILGMCVKYHVL